ncbi:MAG TPA: hypothetical protein VNU44_10955 [Bryobacteraceae bacterium]|jgi:hypothetical protein|nr:hypothetical protein [Bryobacteraceae bacterium]
MNLVPNGNGSHGSLLLLAPADAEIPNTLTGVEWNPQSHSALLASLQRLRGRVYLEDGAIERSALSTDGRYIQPADEEAWHLIALNGRGVVSGCARYMAHPGYVRFRDTGVSNSPLSWSADWASSLRTAVKSEIERANRLAIDFVEVGGWALTPELRGTSAALRIALGTFSVARLLGGCIGLTTATSRHSSASILGRIGGQPLTTGGREIPGYFDPAYRCHMEILRFHSARPNPRFERSIEDLKNHLSTVPVICRSVRLPAIAA